MNLKCNNELLTGDGITPNPLKIGKQYCVKLSQIFDSVFNREKMEAHVKTMKREMRKNGVLRPITVIPTDKSGMHEIVDATHLYYAYVEICEEYGIPLDEFLVPVFDLYWIDPTDRDIVQATMIALNQHFKNWKSLDFIKTYCQTKDNSYIRLLSAIKKYKKRNKFSIGVVIAAYCKASRISLNHPLKLGTLKFNPKDEKISEKILECISEWKDVNTSILSRNSNQWFRELVVYLWKKADYYNGDINTFSNFLEIITPGVKLFLKHQNVLSTNSEKLAEDMDTIISSFENIPKNT